MADFDPVSYIMGAKAGGGGGGGASTLSGLTDVDISNPSDGQTLVYNAESGKWENGAGGGVMPNFTLNRTSQTGGTATCNMTFDSIMTAIRRGMLTGATFAIGGIEGVAYQYAPLSFVNFTSTEMDVPYVTFTSYELDGGGNILWNTVYMTAQEIEYTVFETRSYPGT